MIEDVDFGVPQNQKEKVVQFLTKLNANFIDVDMPSRLARIIKLVTDSITAQIIVTVESQLISPVSSFYVGKAVSGISSKIQSSIIKSSLVSEIENIKRQKEELEGLENRTSKQNNKLLALEEDLNEKNYLYCSSKNSPPTFSNLIQFEAQKHTINYSQCEIIHHAQTRDINDKTKISREVKAKADAIRAGKEADMATMYAMAADNGIKPFKIVTNENYQLTAEDKEKGVTVVVFIKRDKDEIGNDGVGHYCLMQGDGTVMSVKSDQKDCGYAVIAHLTGKSIEQIRDETATTIETNPSNFGKAIKAEAWLQNRHPQLANTLLFKGGCGKCHGISVDAKDFKLIDRNKKQYVVKKTWYRTIKDAAGVAKQIGYVLTSTGDILIFFDVTGVISSTCLMTGKFLIIGASAVKTINELVKGGADNGVLSKAFASEVFKQASEEFEQLLSGAIQLKLVSKGSSLCNKLESVGESVEYLYLLYEKSGLSGKSSNEDPSNIDQLEGAVETFNLIKQTLKMSLKLLPMPNKESEKMMHKVHDKMTLLSNCLEKYITPFQEDKNRYNEASELFTSLTTNYNGVSEDIIKTIKDDENYYVEYNASIQGLVEANEKKVIKHFGEEHWSQLDNQSKAKILKNLMLHNNLDGPISNNNKSYFNQLSGYIKGKFYDHGSLEGKVLKVLEDPSKTHIFCKTEDKMYATDNIKTENKEDDSVKRHYYPEDPNDYIDNWRYYSET